MPAALVTGAARGIGKAIALELAREGYNIAVHYRSSQQAAETVVAQAQSLGVKAVALKADVTDADEAQILVQQAYGCFGRLDVLVNNVGNYHKGPLDELPFSVWHEMLASNLHASFYTCQTAIPIMRQQTYGRIINLGYAGAEQMQVQPQVIAYNIAKTGVILYSKALAKAEAAHGITVNVVSPGVLENSDSKPMAELPMKRTGTLKELCAAVRYLLSPEARYVTGITIEVAGGWKL